MPALGAVLGWFFGLFTKFAAWLWLAIVARIGLGQITDAAARLVRMGLGIALIIAAVNWVVPPEFTSFTNLWDSYSAELGAAADYAEFFFPMDLLWLLLDLYVAAVVVLFSISLVRRTLDMGK